MFKEMLQLHNHDIISVIGAGGKTSLIFTLAQYLYENFNAGVLVTTTTKMMCPTPGQCHGVYFVQDNNIKKPAGGGIVFLAGGLLPGGQKVYGPPLDYLENILPAFDYVLIESDGSKKKKLKGWSRHEPVIIKETTKTIGVLTTGLLGYPICEEYIHRAGIFKNEFAVHGEEVVTPSCLNQIITGPNGMYKKAVGDKVLFINQLDTLEERKETAKMVNEYTAEWFKTLSVIILGSLKEGVYQWGFRL